MLEVKITDMKAECEVFFIASVEEAKDKELLQEMNFKDALFVQASKALYIKIDSQEKDVLREAASKAIKAIKKLPYRSAKVHLCGGKEEVQAILMGLYCGDYAFEQYKTQKEEKVLREIYIDCQCEKIEDIVYECEIIASSVCFVRDLVNTAPNEATPEFLAEVAQKEAQRLKIECKIFDVEMMKKEKMHSLLAVARASSQEPRLIHLTYKPQNAKAKVVFVGKGLTYDSGGLSLKPSDYMVTMKADKSGGCAVIGIISAIAQLGLPLEVHGVIGAVENMIGGNAYKPDDILHSREGKSIEVRNTDAEGRLVLADCLSYAQDLNPDYLIDLATLTGACVVGLGEYTYAIMGFNEKLKDQFEKSAVQSGELVAQLPFNTHLKKLIDSKIADVCNVSSSRYGGAITAGLFLAEFVRKEYQHKWLHLDIAGPAYIEKEWDINPYGASGIGVRGCVEFAKFLSEEK
ncbi:leucyl aminopeptidase [Helicobacter kayseriensis]|uniref:leucyl aminopeptidase n=1 Tax=Helicobacter kayseriensis TaxID=2905877 RepID=UPI001E4D1892|nr:leucyl aminopeptidase [Helicobacter kayseriensis]MCE3046497.1 leucyl aminopeptidase [Helicobacter kayseriensis]MCE3048200.1 leucyl aminopeptidase [Helicobacter kayseriensis]